MPRVQPHLQTCITYLQDCQAAYLNASPTVRRQLNQAFFDKIYVDEDGAVRFDMADPFALLPDPQVRSAAITSSAIEDQAMETSRSPETEDSAQHPAGYRFAGV